MLKDKRLIKYLLLSILLIIITIFGAYNFLTCSFGLKNITLPVVAKLLDGTVKVDHAQLSLISGKLELKNLTFKSIDDYSLKLKSLEAKLKPISLLSSKLEVQELKSDGLTFDLLIDKTKKVEENNSTEGSSHDEPAEFYFDISNFQANNCSFFLTIKRDKKEHNTYFEAKNHNITADSFVTGQSNLINCNGNYMFDTKRGESTYERNIRFSLLSKIDKFMLPTYINLVAMSESKDFVTPFQLKFIKMPMNRYGKNPFAVRFKAKNLNLQSVFKALIRGNYSNTAGTVESYSVIIRGDDINNIDLSKNVTGFFLADINDFDLPITLVHYEILRLFFLPIEVLANINEFTKSKIVPPMLENVFKEMNQIVDKAKVMHFDQGNINLILNDGVLKVNNFVFEGGTSNVIRNISYEGSVKVNGELDIETKVSCLGIIVPLRFRGTTDKPKVEILMILPGVIIDTTANVAVSGFDLFMDVGKGISNTISTTAGKVEDAFNNNKSDGSGIDENQ